MINRYLTENNYRVREDGCADCKYCYYNPYNDFFQCRIAGYELVEREGTCDKYEPCPVVEQSKRKV
jgi:hypothetical protein